MKTIAELRLENDVLKAEVTKVEKEMAEYRRLQELELKANTRRSELLNLINGNMVQIIAIYAKEGKK